MELIFNELSLFPIAENSQFAEERFRGLIRTFSEARAKLDFTHIRFPVNYSGLQVTSSQNLTEWVTNCSNPTLKNLILTLFKPPFTDELEEGELASYFQSSYSIASEESPVNDSPVGMPVAYIKALPAISCDAHEFWRNRKIEIVKSNERESENNTFFVYNICLESDVLSGELNEWKETCMPSFIRSEAEINNYLGYQKFTTGYSDSFLKDFFEWKEKDFNSFQYLLRLMKDVELHPFTGGMGQTENLKGRGKEASKRINIRDRLSYSIENNIVTFIACKGHYEFH